MPLLRYDLSSAEADSGQDGDEPNGSDLRYWRGLGSYLPNHGQIESWLFDLASWMLDDRRELVDTLSLSLSGPPNVRQEIIGSVTAGLDSLRKSVVATARNVLRGTLLDDIGPQNTKTAGSFPEPQTIVRPLGRGGIDFASLLNTDYGWPVTRGRIEVREFLQDVRRATHLRSVEWIEASFDLVVPRGPLSQ